MEGRILSKEFYGIQCLHLSYSHSRINGNFWMKGFGTSLSTMTLSAPTNNSRTSRKYNYKLTYSRHSRFLLRIDTEILRTSDYKTQVLYWVTATEATWQAQASALLHSTTTRPALTTFGTLQTLPTLPPT